MDKMKSEHEIQNEIRNALAKPPGGGTRNIFRVWCGKGKLEHGAFINGADNGTADLCGWQSVKITPEMAGKNIAVFVGIEVKREKGGRSSPAQISFGEALRRDGGIHCVARSAEEAMKIVEEFK
jgi:hypothetical protein